MLIWDSALKKKKKKTWGGCCFPLYWLLIQQICVFSCFNKVCKPFRDWSTLFSYKASWHWQGSCLENCHAGYTCGAKGRLNSSKTPWKHWSSQAVLWIQDLYTLCQCDSVELVSWMTSKWCQHEGLFPLQASNTPIFAHFKGSASNTYFQTVWH